MTTRWARARSSSQIRLSPFRLDALVLARSCLAPTRFAPAFPTNFLQAENLGLFVQVYNLRPDESLHKSDIFVTYRLLKGQREIWMATETSDAIRQTGEQVTLNRLVPLSSFAPGRYWLEVTVRDRVSGQSISRDAEFTLKP